MRMKRLVSLLLAALIFSASIALAAQASGEPVDEGGGAEFSTGFSKPSAEELSGELERRRTATSETFRLANGELETRMYETPINYLGTEGEWTPIDEGLHPAQDAALSNGANSFDLDLPSQMGAGPVRLSNGGEWVAYELRGAATKSVEAEDNVASYESAGLGADFELTSFANGLKDDIVIDGPTTPSVFSFDLTASPGVTAEPQSDGSIRFHDDEGEVVAELPTPLMSDSAPGRPAISHDVHYELEASGAGQWLLKVVASKAWLEDEERSFPVTLDPTLTVPAPALDCTYGYYPPNPTYWSACGSTGYQKLYVTQEPELSGPGEGDRSAIRFDLSAIPAGAYVSDATLGLYSPEGSWGTSGVEVRQATKSWGSDVDWDTAVGNLAWTELGGDYTSYGSEILTSDRGSGAGWWNFSGDPHAEHLENDLATLVRRWISGQAANQGLIVKLRDETDCGGGVSCVGRGIYFNTSAVAESSKRPYLSVTYTPPPAPNPPSLDALNRTETPLSNGAKWSALAWSGGTQKTGRDTTGGWGPYDAYSTVNGAYWNPSTFSEGSSGDAAAITMQTAPGIESRYVGLWLNMSSPGTTKSGYQLRWTVNPSTSTYTVKLSKWSAGTETVLASNASVSIPAGSTLLIADTGNAVTAWQGTGGTLTPLLSAADSTYSSGYAGIEGSGSNSRSLDFRAGSISSSPPDTTISNAPNGIVTPEVAFSFSSTPSGASFECSLDGSAFAACTSPKHYTGLAEGPHTLQVRAVGAGGADVIPAERGFQVIETAKAVPKVALLDNLERQEVPLATGKWSKAFWAGEIGGVWMGGYRGYGSSGSQLASAYWNQTSFSDATGAVLATATVGTGATPSGERLALWLDTPGTNSQSGYEARFEGTNGSASGYKVELAKWSAGTRTVLGSTTGFSLPVGTTMVLTDTGGRVTLWSGVSSFTPVLSANDSTYASGYAGLEVKGGAGTEYNFRAGNVDLQAPSTTITNGPTGKVPPNVSFLFASSESGSSFECSMDGGSYGSCPTPKEYKGLAEGWHLFRVRAKDAAGNIDLTPAQRSFETYPKPKAVTASTPNINTTSTTLNGIVNPRGIATTYQFEYGTTTSYGTKIPSSGANVGSGNSDVPVGQLISGLQGGTVYHYRVAATSAGGTSYGEDRTFKVDLKSPIVDFASSQTGSSTPAYTLSINAEDAGAAATGVQRIDVLLNGSLDETFPQSCQGDCPVITEKTWQHDFTHALDGTDHLTVLVVDQANNVASFAFDLPSKIVHATVYTENPAAGGAQISEEWLQLHTHNGRFQDSAKTMTRGNSVCSESSSDWCSFLRTKMIEGEFSEVATPIDQPTSISEVGTLSLPSQPEFGLVSSGATSNIIKSWQVLPPGAGSTYEKVVSKNEASEPQGQSSQTAGEWAFWIDAATELPLKSFLSGGTEEGRTFYYSYAPSILEAGDLSPSFLLFPRPTRQEQGCLASGQLGGWSFNEAGLTNPDPRFNSVVNTATGPMILTPEGAAADGYDPRVTLTQDGVEMATGPSDEGELTWEFTEAQGQTLEPVGTDTLVVSEGGVASAIIQPTPASGAEVVDGAPESPEDGSGDTVVLDPTASGTSAEVQSIGAQTDNNGLCITQSQVNHGKEVYDEAVAAGVVMVKPQASTTQTTQVKIWINPHPALAGVSVTDKYGTCSGPSPKTFGTDGYVIFGGCPIGKSATFTVPSETSAGGIIYRVPDPSRTISPPSYGWTIDFNYAAQAPSPPPPPPPSPPAPFELRIGSNWVEADGATAEASEGEVQIPPQYGCFAEHTRPWRTDSAIPNQFAVRAKMRFRCRKEVYLIDWWSNFHLSRWVKDSNEWKQRAETKPKGEGPAVTTQGPFFIGTECRHLSNLLEEPQKLWRSEIKVMGIYGIPGGTVSSGSHFSVTDGKKLSCE